MDVLVLDEDVALSSSIVGLIRGWGYNAEASTTGRNALKRVGEKDFDLVLINLSPADMTAQDLIGKLKDLHPEIGVVTMTEESTDQLEAEIRTLGIVYYMSKPINEMVLKQILDHSATKKSQRGLSKGGFQKF